MRGHVTKQQPLFVMLDVEAMVPADHPLRPIKRRCDTILAAMRRDFNAAYSRMGRPSVPPEQMLKALVLQALYSIPSETKLMEHIRFNLLYRWFLDLPGDAEVWTPEAFSMNRERFAEHRLVKKFFDRVVAEAITEGLVSQEHFTVDGTLIQSWASLKSLEPRTDEADRPQRQDDDPGNPNVDFRGQKRSNQTHVSRTDPEALLARKGKGKEALLSHSGHVLMENRNGLVLAAAVDAADGTAERRSAKGMLKHVRKRHRLTPETIGMDSAYDDGAFLAELESEQEVVPHVPIRRGYRMSQWIRKRVEEIFGWMKTVAGLARTRFVGRWKILQELLVAGAAYNLVRLARLKGPPEAEAEA